MLKSLRIYKLIAIVAVLAMLASTATCFAFFGRVGNVSPVTVSEAVGAKTSNVELVGNEFALRAAAVDSAFNSPNRFSNASGRKVIALTDDITLTTNLMVTADCALDLGDHNIDLNGHEIIFRNGYSGVFEIVGGTGKITGEGKVWIDLAHMQIGDVADYIDENVVLDLNGPSETSMAAIVFSFVGQKILGGENRGYFYDAVDLPLHYQSFDGIELSYSSSNTSVLSDAGVVAAQSGINSDVTIILALRFAETGSTYSQSWDVHIITLDQKAAWGTAMFNMVCDELSMYKGETTDTYYFGDGMVLPGDFSYPQQGGNASSVSYAVFNDAGGAPGSTCLSDLRNYSESDPPYLLKPFNGNSQYLLNTNVDVETRYAWLRIYSSMNDYAPCGDIRIFIMNDSDAASATRDILKAGLGEDYENQNLTIELESQVGDVYRYTQYQLVTSGQVRVNGIDVTPTKFEYTFEEEDAPYEIVENAGGLLLRVKESAWGTLDTETPDYYLKAAFSYGSGESAQVGMEFIRVHYNPRVEQDFYPYYKQLDYALKQLKTDNSYTYKSFTMPANTNGRKPYIQYQIEDVDTGATQYVSLSHVYDPEVDNAGLYRSDDVFAIDPKRLTTDDYKFRIYYWYSFDGQEWSRINTSGSSKNARRAQLIAENGHLTPAEEAELTLTLEDYYYTEITIQGIVSDASNSRAVPDNQLFNAMYSTYGGTTCSALDGSTIRVIPSVNLTIQNDNFDIPTLRSSGVVTADITNLTGIRLLTNTKRIGLRNSVSSSISLEPLSAMTNVEEVDLGENELSEMSSIWRNDGTGKSQMERLRVLWLDNNMIERFYYLDSFPALETVYVNDQNVRTYTGIFSGIINDIREALYGSTGAFNGAIFSSAIANGVDVYNVYRNGTYSYSSGEGSNDAYAKGSKVLIGMEYQQLTVNPLFNPAAGGTSAQRTEFLAETVFGKEQEITYPGGSFGWWNSYDTVPVPSTTGMKVLENTNKNTPPKLQMVETRLADGFSYNVQISRMLQDGAGGLFNTGYGWVTVLEYEITIKYTPFIDIVYSETAPTRMFMMSPEMLSIKNGAFEGTDAAINSENIDISGTDANIYNISGDSASE